MKLVSIKLSKVTGSAKLQLNSETVTIKSVSHMYMNSKSKMSVHQLTP